MALGRTLAVCFLLCVSLFLGVYSKAPLRVPIVDPAKLYSSIEHALEHDDGVISFAKLVGNVDWETVCLIAPYSTPKNEIGLHIADEKYFDDKFFNGVDEDNWGMGFVFIKSSAPVLYAHLPPSLILPKMGKNIKKIAERKGVKTLKDGDIVLSGIGWSNHDQESEFNTSSGNRNICFTKEYALEITPDWMLKVLEK